MTYLVALEAAAIQAADEQRPVYVVRDPAGFAVEVKFPAGFACVQVQPNGQTREIGGHVQQPIGIRAGSWTGD